MLKIILVSALLLAGFAWFCTKLADEIYQQFENQQ